MHTYHLTQWLLFFFIYSFIGWIWESCYVSARQRRWVNRGFLHGPMLPIYGSGALVILVSTIGVREHPWLIFLFGMIAATALEYVTGAVMERLFHVRYWDYSNQKLNVNGYICASSTLCWGVFSVLLVRVVHVPIERVVLDIPLLLTDGLALVLTIAASVDMTQSFNEAMDLRRVLVQLEESREQIRRMEEKLRTATGELIDDYRQRSGELITDYRQRAEKLAEEYRKRSEEVVENYRKRAAGHRKKRKEQRAAYLEWINVKRAQKRLRLEELTERAEALFGGQTGQQADGPERGPQSREGERRGDIAGFREKIAAELEKLHSRTDRNYLHIAGQLKRNPTAASKQFADALAELKDALEHMK